MNRVLSGLKLKRVFIPLCLLALIVVVLLITHPSQHRLRLLGIANQQIDGQLDLANIQFSWLEPWLLRLQRLSLQNQQGENLASIEELVLDVSLASLLSEQLRVKRLVLDNVNIDSSVQAMQLAVMPIDDSADRQEPQVNDTASLPLTAVVIEELEVNGDIHVSDVADGVHVEGLMLKLADVLIELENVQQSRMDLSLLASNVQQGGQMFGPIEADINIANRQAALSIQKLLGITGTLNLSNAKSSEEGYFVDAIDVSVVLADTLRPWLTEQMVSGIASIKGNASLGGNPPDASNLSAELSVAGEGILVQGFDLNAALTGLEEANETTLLDLGGVLLTGPIGLIGSQLTKLGSAGVGTLSGETKIEQMLLDINVDKGLLSTEDVALATDTHRVSFDGKINLVTTEFQEMDFYLLDDKGCALADQQLNGAITDPDGTGAALLSTKIVKPFTNILSSVTELVSSCDVVYQGAISHPQ